MQFFGADITGATLGMVGAGRIGSTMTRRSISFGMKVLYTDLARNLELEKSLNAK